MKTFTSKSIAAGAGCIALASLFSPVASATDLYLNESLTFPATSSTQLGRLSRNSVQQTWDPTTSGETAYPGAINTTTTYNYETFTFPAADFTGGQYVQIDISEPNAADLFASAWTTYSGTASLTSGTGWLGDAGQSEDYAFTSIPPTPQDPRFFNVTVPTGAGLTVVVNTTSAAALGEAFGLQVESFSTKDYTDSTSAIPEPSTWAMLGAGLLFGGATVIRRRRASV